MILALALAAALSRCYEPAAALPECPGIRREGIYEGVEEILIAATGAEDKEVAAAVRAEVERHGLLVAEPTALTPKGVLVSARTICAGDVCAMELQAIRIGHIGRLSRMTVHYVAVWGNFAIMKRKALAAGAQVLAERWVKNYLELKPGGATA